MHQLDPKFHGYIVKSLRRIWGWYPERSKARVRAEVSRNVYSCEECGIIAERKQTEVDHKIPVIPLEGFDSYNGLIERLFCPASGLAVVCKDCHKKKTRAEAGVRARHRREIK